MILYSESLYESSELSNEAHNAAALLASKLYYYLGDYDEALSFALNAGDAFEQEGRTPGAEEYVETVICEWQYLELCHSMLSISINCSQGYRPLCRIKTRRAD